MAFDGSEGGAITLAQGAAMTQEYRRRGGSTTLGHFFGKNILNDILSQDGCVGIRIYYAMNPDNGNKELVLVGTDADENDILDLVADFSEPCPTRCSSANCLNCDD